MKIKKSLIIFVLIFALILLTFSVTGFTIIECAGDGTCCDEDADGYGVLGQVSCTYPSEVDCDDNDATINPGATEICDVIDNNCDSIIDEGCSDNNILLGSVNTNYLYYSNDGATSWLQSNSGIGGTEAFYKLYQADNGIIYVGTGIRGMLYYYDYENNGLNLIYEFDDFFTNIDTNIIGILETNDGSLVVAVSYDDGGSSSGGEVYYSTSGINSLGQQDWTVGSFDSSVGEKIQAMAYSPTLDRIIIGLGTSTGTSIYFSDDKGANWQTSTLSNINIASLYYDEANDRFLAGTTDTLGNAEIYYSSDGKGWYRSSIQGNFAGAFRDFATDSNNQIFVVGYEATYGASAVHRSTDGGLSWADRGNFLEDNLLYAIAIDENNAIYIAGYTGAVYKSLDGGASWRKISEPTSNMITDLLFYSELTCIDSDGDGYGSTGSATCIYPGEVDCDDSDANINPGVIEVCNDGIDNDCDATTDDACTYIEGCYFASVEWQDEGGSTLTIAGEGYTVYMNLDAPNCEGESITFEIYSEDDTYLESTSEIVSSNIATASWETDYGLGNYYFIASNGIESLTSDYLEVADCEVEGLPDSDCDGVADEDDLYDAPSDTSDANGVPADTNSCWETWDCTSWSDCVNNIQTRTCSATHSDEECQNVATPPTEMECLVEEDFPFFDWLNIVFVLFLLVGYYWYKKD